MSLVIKKRTQSQEKIKSLGLEPKLPTRNKKLRMTPPKQTQEKKAFMKTPEEENFKKKKKSKRKARGQRIIFEDHAIVKKLKFPYNYLNTSSYKEESNKLYFKTA